MEEITIQSWTDLTSKIEEWGGTSYVFRGVPKKDFELIPKVGREVARLNAPYSELLEMAIYAEFKTRAVAFLDKMPRNPLEWLILAQHHGLPTRLLDWSHSLLIAAYFAVQEMGAGGDAAIYVAPTFEKFFSEDRDPFANFREVQMIYPVHLSPRIPSQCSMFTLHPNPDQPYEPEGLIKLIIPKDLCGDTKMLLSQCGVSAGNLFPDLDGLCSELLWRLKWSTD